MLLVFAAIGAGCSGDPHGGAPPIGVGDGGAEHDAAIREDGAGDAPVGDAGDDEPPTDCTPRFDALDTSCTVDDHCVRVVQSDCFHAGGGVSLVRGVARSAVAEFEALVTECELVTPATADERCPGEGGGLGPEIAQEGELEQTNSWPIVVRCSEGHCRSFRTQCGPELCGNGEVDGCLVTESALGSAFTPQPPSESPEVREQCDGADVAGRSCEDEGFGSGAMQCLDNVCAIDDSACSPCLEPMGALAACVGDALDGMDPASLSDIAVAPSATEIAVVFVRQPMVHVLRYDGAFERIGEVSFRISDDDALLVSHPLLAPYPGGFIVAFDVAQLVVGQGIASEDVEVHALNPDGSHAGLVGKLSGARGSRLVAREGGTPLLLASRPTADGALMSSAVAIAADASSFSTITDLGAVRVHDAVVAGDGYLVALGSPAAPIALQRVGLDGALIGSAAGHAMQVMELALIAGESSVRMLYTENGQSLIVDVTNEGALVGTAQPLAPVHPSLGARILAQGSDLIVTESMGSDTSLVRIDATLQRTPITAVSRHPAYGGPLALFAFGEQVVVAIAGESGAAQTALTLAAISP